MANWVSTEEASKIFKVSQSTIRNRCKMGVLKSKKDKANHLLVFIPDVKKVTIKGGNLVIDKIYFEVNKNEKTRVQKLCSNFQEIINRKYKNESEGIETTFEEDFNFYKNILPESQIKKIKNKESFNDEIQKFIFKEAPECKKYLEIYGNGKLKSPVTETPKTPNGLKMLLLSPVDDLKTVLL